MGGLRILRAPLRHLLLVLAVAVASPATPARAEPRLVSVAPGGGDGLLTCRLTTADLPGERIVSTLESGLVSAIEFHLDVVQDDDRAVIGNIVTVRLSFDLWEEVYTVSLGEQRTRLPDLAALRAWLAEPPALPVAPLEALDAALPAVIRAGLQLHPIAPDTRGRMEGMISGSDTGGDGPGQEVLVGLDTLIRFFYRDGSGEDRDHELASTAFIIGELSP